MPLTHTTVVYDPSGSMAARFWAKADRSGPCWLWTASTNERGYGVFNTGTRVRAAHVVSWEMVNGPVPQGREVNHACHDADRSCPGGPQCQHRTCVNPAHLEAVTHQENCRSGRKGDRQVTCKRGHPFTPENALLTKRGTQQCRTCKRMRERLNAARNREGA